MQTRATMNLEREGGNNKRRGPCIRTCPRDGSVKSRTSHARCRTCAGAHTLTLTRSCFTRAARTADYLEKAANGAQRREPGRSNHRALRRLAANDARNRPAGRGQPSDGPMTETPRRIRHFGNPRPRAYRWATRRSADKRRFDCLPRGMWRGRWCDGLPWRLLRRTVRRWFFGALAANHHLVR